MAEVRGGTIVAGEPDIVGCGNDDIGDHPALQAAHPVGQHLGWDTADHR